MKVDLVNHGKEVEVFNGDLLLGWYRYFKLGGWSAINNRYSPLLARKYWLPPVPRECTAKELVTGLKAIYENR